MKALLMIGIVSALFTPARVLACATTGKSASKEDLEWTRKNFLTGNRSPAAAPRRAGPMPRLPQFPGDTTQLPWGGRNPAEWSTEAMLANATSKALNEGWSRLATHDVIVAVPVAMIPSGLRPYGDGQTNAGVKFPDWTRKVPPLVATLIRQRSGPERLHIRVHEDLAKTPALTIVYFVETPLGSKNFQQRTARIPLRRDSGAIGPDFATFSGEWSVDRSKKWGDLDGSAPAFVQPEGWGDWFPIDFRHPVYTEAELDRATGGTKMPGGRPLWDPESIRDISDGKTAFQDLQERQNAGKMNGGWFYVIPKNVHAWMPEGNELRLTATGVGWTWVIDAGPKASFKTLYTCFERRSVTNETTGRSAVAARSMSDSDQQHIRQGRTIRAPQTLVSGGGWHEIGDAAETIINNVEPDPVVVGMATGMPWHQPPNGGGFAYKLTDVATVRWLRPGEGLVTPAGEQTLKEGYGKDRGNPAVPGGRNYHWFFFQSDREVCTQEWVHNCVPTSKNHLGLRCSK